MNIQVALRQWLPLGLRQGINSALGYSLRYKGPFPDFDTASQQSAGYADPSIIGEVVAATEEVLAGKATYSQDGRTFRENGPPQHALSGVLLATSLFRGPLRFLDVGGGLASHYLRWKPFLDQLPIETWEILEQNGLVEAGKSLFAADSVVRLIGNIGEATIRPTAAILSSVLQYLPDPNQMLTDVQALAPAVIIVDRTPFSAATQNAYFVQSYRSRSGSRHSYPLCVFHRRWLSEALSTRYRCILEFDSGDQPIEQRDMKANYSGSIWIEKSIQNGRDP